MRPVCEIKSLIIAEDKQELSYSDPGALDDVMGSKGDLQTYTNEFESHWEPHSIGLVPRLYKTFNKLLFPSDHRQTITLEQRIQ